MPLFRGVEQGLEQKKHCVFLLMTSKLRSEVQLWLKQNFEMKLKFSEERKYKCSVTINMNGNNNYNEKLINFLNNSLCCKHVLKANNFDVKYTSFAQVVKVNNN